MINVTSNITCVFYTVYNERVKAVETVHSSLKSLCRAYQQSKQWAVYLALDVVVCS